jgi:hypothetical protein
MKTSKRHIITISFLFGIIGCSGGHSDTTTSEDASTTTELENVVSTESSTIIKSWTRVGTIDDFGKETGESVIAANFTGTMSNSATTNSPLIVRAQMSDGKLYMQFLEYGRQPANMPDNRFIYVSVRRPGGDVETVGQFLFRGYMADTGYLPGSNTLTGGDGKTKDNQLLDLLLEETEPITVRVEMSRADRNNSAVYVFDMDNGGLRDLLQ